MESIEKSIEVKVPVQQAYSQWTHFEEFPEFMEGVEEVRKLDDTHLHWVAEVGGKKREWDTEIYAQVPERRIAWRSTAGTRHGSEVELLPKDPEHTRVTLKMFYEPEDTSDRAGDVLDAATRRVEGDLERFRELVQSHK